MTLGEYLKSKNITQEAFAAALGVQQPQVSKLVKGTARVTPEMALEISRVTGGNVSVSELVPEFVEAFKAELVDRDHDDSDSERVA